MLVPARAEWTIRIFAGGGFPLRVGLFKTSNEALDYGGERLSGLCWGLEALGDRVVSPRQARVNDSKVKHILRMLLFYEEGALSLDDCVRCILIGLL